MKSEVMKLNYYGGFGCDEMVCFFLFYGNVQTGRKEERPEQDGRWVPTIFTLAKLVLLSVM